MYEALHLWSGVNGYSAFNIGFSPASPEIVADPRFAREAYQIQLYAELLGFGGLGDWDPAPQRILEVGVGGGGGLQYIKSRLATVQAVGVDNAAAAVAFARRRGISARVATADKLPFPGQHFDCVMCVDSFSIFPRARFLTEVRRVLRPAGRLLIGDYLVARAETIKAELVETAAAGQFQIERFADMTTGVLAALEADHERKARIVAHLPKRLRNTMGETMSLHGSERYRNWQAGNSCYYMAVLRCNGDAI